MKTALKIIFAKKVLFALPNAIISIVLLSVIMGQELSMYPCQVAFKRLFVQGNLRGIVHDDYMGFMSWDDACEWAAKVTESRSVNYIVTEMTDIGTGKKETF